MLCLTPQHIIVFISIFYRWHLNCRPKVESAQVQRQDCEDKVNFWTEMTNKVFRLWTWIEAPKVWNYTPLALYLLKGLFSSSYWNLLLITLAPMMNYEISLSQVAHCGYFDCNQCQKKTETYCSVSKLWLCYYWLGQVQCRVTVLDAVFRVVYWQSYRCQSRLSGTYNFKVHWFDNVIQGISASIVIPYFWHLVV